MGQPVCIEPAHLCPDAQGQGRNAWRIIAMSEGNGKNEAAADQTSQSWIYMMVLRLWVACFIIIVVAGVANYLLNWFVGTK